MADSGAGYRQDLARRTPADTVVGLALAAAALALGLVRLSDRLSFWRDEAFSVAVVRRPLLDMLRVVTTEEPGMSAYYVALWLWTRVSTSDTWVRGFTVLGSGVAVWLIFRLARRSMAICPAAVVAGAVLVGDTMHKFHTEARSYTWLMSVTALLGLTAHRLHRSLRIGDALLLGAVGGLGVALTPVFSVWVGALLVALHWCDSAHGYRWRHSAAVIAAAGPVALPVLPVLVRQRELVNWIERPTPRYVATEILKLLSSTRMLVVIVVGVAIAAAAVLRNPGRRKDFGLVAALLCGFPPIAVVVVESWVAQPLFQRRYVMSSMVFLLISAVQGYTMIARPAVRRATLSLFAVLAVSAWWQRAPFDDIARSDDLRAASAYLAQRIHTDDVVLITPRPVRVMLQHYGGWSAAQDILVPAQRNPYIPEEQLTEAALTRLRAAPRVWLITKPFTPIGGEQVPRVLGCVQARPTITDQLVGDFRFRLFGPAAAGECQPTP